MNKDLYPFEEFKPDFENEEGIKYWEIESLNKKFKDAKVDIRAYNVLWPSGDKKRILLDKKGVFYETTNFESICQKADLEILIENKNGKSKNN